MPTYNQKERKQSAVSAIKPHYGKPRVVQSLGLSSDDRATLPADARVRITKRGKVTIAVYFRPKA